MPPVFGVKNSLPGAIVWEAGMQQTEICYSLVEDLRQLEQVGRGFAVVSYSVL